MLERDVARQIKEWREDGGCSQSWLAGRASMPQSEISRLEKGNHLPSLRTLRKVAKAFNAEVVVRIVRKDRSPLNGPLVDRIAASIVDCHPDSGRGATWDDWIKQTKNKKLKPYERRMAREWIAARRNEARSAILAMRVPKRLGKTPRLDAEETMSDGIIMTGMTRAEYEASLLAEIERLRPPPGSIQISLLRRDDGGLRICSTTHPGLILSGPEPEKVLACVWPALQALANASRPGRPPVGTPCQHTPCSFPNCGCDNPLP